MMNLTDLCRDCDWLLQIDQQNNYQSALMSIIEYTIYFGIKTGVLPMTDTTRKQ